MAERDDAVEWSREHWIAGGQPAPEQFTAMAAILRTHQAMTASIDATLRVYDLTRTGYLLMTTLQLSRDGTRPLGQLSRHLMVHPTTVTLVIDQLEGKEQVSRRPHPTDRRTVLATLTEEGRRAVTKAASDLAGAQFGLTGTSDTMAQRLTTLLGQVRTRMGDAP
jgi:DNA-binding MarR family transcriptional regulator